MGRAQPWIALLALAAATQLSAQASYTVPRTPWGDPDVQGIWSSERMNSVAFERAEELGTRATLTEEEFRARSAALQQQIDIANAPTVVPGSRTGVNPPAHWLELSGASRQASLIIDPPDGRLPPMTPDGAARARRWPGPETSYFARPEDANPYDRCISRGTLGSAFPNIYNNGMEILQAPGIVAIRYEMIHETRIIPLDRRPRLHERIRSYMGDSRGHWEGDALVVEAANFNGKTGSYGRNGNGNPTSDALRLVERFTMTAADTLQYQVTVHDPQTWTRPWTVAFPLARDSDYVIHEYACHEGNYAIGNMLRISREADRRPLRGQ